MIQRSMTVPEFLENRSSLPDGGQWAELIRGVPVSLQPPDLEHGTIVLNLSKAFSSYVHSSFNGYACFDLGLHVEQAPDTVYFPAAVYFVSEPRFAEVDLEVTRSVPVLAVELATTSDRRSQISERVSAYQRHGVPVIWLIDPHFRTVHVCETGKIGTMRLEEPDTLSGSTTLPGFEVRVGDLFAPPDWV